MNDFKVETEPFPKKSEFTGGDGYAQKIYDKAVEVRGEHELHYIPEDSEVSWAAGKTWNDILAMPEDKRDQFWEYGTKNGGYATRDNGQPPGNQPYLGTAAEWAEVREELKWAKEWWDNQLGPEPDTFEGTIKDYGNAAKALYDEGSGAGAGGTPYSSGTQAISGWHSTAANNFRNNIWFRIPMIIRRQSAMAAVLAHGMAAERDTWVQHRKTHKDIAEKTLTALEAVRAETDNDAAEQTILAGVFTAAAGVFTIPFTGGGSALAVAAGISTFAAGVYTVAAGQSSMAKPEKVPLGDSTVSGVLLNMASAGSNANSKVDDDETIIIDELQKSYDRLTDSSTKESDSDIPAEDLPEGVQPGDMDEPTFTPRQKFVIPKPKFLGEAEKLPEPEVAT